MQTAEYNNKSLLLRIFYRSLLIRFILLGAFCAGIEFLLFTWLVFNYDLEYLHANFISLIVAVIINYMFSTRVVFKRGSYSARLTFVAFILVTILSVALNQFMVWFLFSTLQAHLPVIKILAIAITAVFNFLSKKYIVFRQKE